MAKAKVGKRTRRGITQESKWWARQAQRLGVTSRWLKKVWGDVKREQNRYRAWRNRWIQSMARESGLPVSVIEGMEGIPPRLGADIEDFRNTKQMRAYIEQMKRTRESRNAARKQMKEQVRRARERFERYTAETSSDVIREELIPGLTRAQHTLMARLDGATLLTEEQYDDLLKEVAQMTDEEIAAFYYEDNGQIFKWLKATSPKILGRSKDEITLDGDVAKDRFTYFRFTLMEVRRG